MANQKKMTQRDFHNALSKLPLPGGAKLKFLKAHADAKGRAANMRLLARKAGYKGWNGMNLQYGILAREVAKAARQPASGITLLVEFVSPTGRENISNSEWVLVMREPFAKALKSAGWI